MILPREVDADAFFVCVLAGIFELELQVTVICSGSDSERWELWR